VEVHLNQFPFVEPATIFSTVSSVSSSSMIWPADFAADLEVTALDAGAVLADQRGVDPDIARATVSSGFFLAPMIAFNDG